MTNVKKLLTTGLLDKAAARKIDQETDLGKLYDSKFSNSKIDVSKLIVDEARK